MTIKFPNFKKNSPIALQTLKIIEKNLRIKINLRNIIFCLFFKTYHVLTM